MHSTCASLTRHPLAAAAGASYSHTSAAPPLKTLFASGHWKEAQRTLLQPLAAACYGPEGRRWLNDRLPTQGAAHTAIARMLTTRACANSRCTDLLGASEAQQPRGRRCGGGCGARYCSEACRDEAWASHAPTCLRLAMQEQRQQQALAAAQQRG